MSVDGIVLLGNSAVVAWLVAFALLARPGDFRRNGSRSPNPGRRARDNTVPPAR